jgi:L-malate glycosyltransferase
VKIGITCYPTYGGSGAVATELGIALAARGHEVHFITYKQPFRLPSFLPRIYFHEVDVGRYPLFEYPPYDLALAVRMHEVVRSHGLDLLHVHYAIPHATSAWIAREMLRETSSDVKVITTLHGTDITLLGSDRSYSETVAFCIEQSDGVTAVSESLKADTYRELGVRHDIRVIPNFLDCSIHRRRDAADLRRTLAPRGEKLLIHVSNFRPVKRVPEVVEIFAAVRRQVDARLLMVGDGPELPEASQLARSLGIAADVEFLGEQDQVVQLLSASDVFLLPSAQESFGLAALEAMACEVPVVASRVGGLPEVIDHGVTGFLHPIDDLAGMAESAVRLLADPELHRRAAQAARQVAHERYCDSKIIPAYEAYYSEILNREPAR